MCQAYHWIFSLHYFFNSQNQLNIISSSLEIRILRLGEDHSFATEVNGIESQTWV